MSKKLTIEELKLKKKFHKKRAKFYNEKTNEAESKSKQIGFKWY